MRYTVLGYQSSSFPCCGTAKDHGRGIRPLLVFVNNFILYCYRYIGLLVWFGIKQIKVRIRVMAETPKVFYSILFYSILFYSILFYSILFVIRVVYDATIILVVYETGTDNNILSLHVMDTKLQSKTWLQMAAILDFKMVDRYML